MEENKSWEWSTVEKTTHRNQSYDLRRNLTKKKRKKGGANSVSSTYFNETKNISGG